MIVEVVAAAGVRLVAVCEIAPALLTPPKSTPLHARSQGYRLRRWLQ
jgi:hypothetical protein